MGVRGLSSTQQCKHTDKREPLEEWNACLGAQVGIRFHPTQLHHCSHDVRGVGESGGICFCSKREQNKLVLQRRVWMRWRRRNLETCKRGRAEERRCRDKVVCGLSQHRQLTICLAVYLFGLGMGEVKWHRVSIKIKHCRFTPVKLWEDNPITRLNLNISSVCWDILKWKTYFDLK